LRRHYAVQQADATWLRQVDRHTRKTRRMLGLEIEVPGFRVALLAFTSARCRLSGGG
jgi:hypothetical protein